MFKQQFCVAHELTGPDKKQWLCLYDPVLKNKCLVLHCINTNLLEAHRNCIIAQKAKCTPVHSLN